MFDTYQIKVYNFVEVIKMYSIDSMINLKSETITLLGRYLYRRDQQNKMVTYLSRFRVEKEEIKKMYETYDEVVEDIYQAFDELNVKESVKESIDDLLSPVIQNVSILSYTYRIFPFFKEPNENQIFEYIFKDMYPEIFKEKLTIKNQFDLNKALEKLDYGDREKRICISFFGNFKPVIEKTELLLDKLVPIVIEKMKPLKKTLERSFLFLEDEKYLKDCLDHWNFPLDNSLVYLFVFRYSTCFYDYIGLEKTHIGFNFMLPEILKINDEKKRDSLQVTNAFKALGDTKRSEIVRLLSIRKRMYVQEMSKECEITPSTILHHLDVLKKACLIETCIDSVDNKRVYYSLNRAMFELLNVNISDIIGGLKK